MTTEELTPDEERLLECYRSLAEEDQNRLKDRAAVLTGDKYRDRLSQWMLQAGEADMVLYNEVENLEELFADMTFTPGSLTSETTAVTCTSDGKEFSAYMDIPEELEYFPMDAVWKKVEPLGRGVKGQFDSLTMELSVAPEYARDRAVILHEMIHMHECILNELPLFYHDTVLFCLYRDLSGKVKDLDDRIQEHSHILNERDLTSTEDMHDTLFLLKSFDLDLRMGWTLGSVLGKTQAEA